MRRIKVSQYKNLDWAEGYNEAVAEMEKEMQEFIQELKEVSEKALSHKHPEGSIGYFDRAVGAEIEYIYKRLELILKEEK